MKKQLLLLAIFSGMMVGCSTTHKSNSKTRTPAAYNERVETCKKKLILNSPELDMVLSKIQDHYKDPTLKPSMFGHHDQIVIELNSYTEKPQIQFVTTTPDGRTPEFYVQLDENCNPILLP